MFFMDRPWLSPWLIKHLTALYWAVFLVSQNCHSVFIVRLEWVKARHRRNRVGRDGHLVVMLPGHWQLSTCCSIYPILALLFCSSRSFEIIVSVLFVPSPYLGISWLCRYSATPITRHRRVRRHIVSGSPWGWITAGPLSSNDACATLISLSLYLLAWCQESREFAVTSGLFRHFISFLGQRMDHGSFTE